MSRVHTEATPPPCIVTEGWVATCTDARWHSLTAFKKSGGVPASSRLLCTTRVVTPSTASVGDAIPPAATWPVILLTDTLPTYPTRCLYCGYFLLFLCIWFFLCFSIRMKPGAPKNLVHQKTWCTKKPGAPKNLVHQKSTATSPATLLTDTLPTSLPGAYIVGIFFFFCASGFLCVFL